MITPPDLVALANAHPEARFMELAALALGGPWEEIEHTDKGQFLITHYVAFRLCHHPEKMGNA